MVIKKKFRFSSRTTAVLRRLNLNGEKTAPRIRTTLVVRAFYGRTIFAINCANRCDVSAMGDPYFRFFARGNYYDSGWIIRTSCSNRCNTSCKIVEEFPPKSLENFFQIAELVSKSLKNLLQNRPRICSKIA